MMKQLYPANDFVKVESNLIDLVVQEGDRVVHDPPDEVVGLHSGGCLVQNLPQLFDVTGLHSDPGTRVEKYLLLVP